MLNLIKSIFGFARPRRSESEEPRSKLKTVEETLSRKTPSMDSKNKRLETEKKVSKISETMFEMDEVGTVKRSNLNGSKVSRAKEKINLDFVSDLNDEKSSAEEYDLLTDMPL